MNSARKGHTPHTEAIQKCLFNVFQQAFSKRPFDALCAILRIEGMSDVGWDPFEESIVFFEDFNWLLKQIDQKKGPASSRRILTLLYCHSVEMSAVHDMLANLLRGIANEPYLLSPFHHLYRKPKKKKGSFNAIPPSALTKFRELKKMAQKAGQNKLVDILDQFFDERIRNAFSHSDFVFTEKEFRFMHGLAHAISLEELDKKIAICFDFYEAFMATHRQVRLEMSQGKRFHQWPNYEVLEVLSAEDGVYGFHVHFSNGTKATCSRKKSGTEAINISIEADGTLNFFVGDIGALEKVWKINGQPVDDWDSLG